MGITASVIYTLYLGYTYGAYNFRVYPFSGGNYEAFAHTIRKIENPFGPDLARMTMAGIGSAVMTVIVILRYQFPGFAFHPIGMVFPFTYLTRNAIFSMFLAWFIKAVLLRLGGVELYRKTQPLFLGLAVGYALGVAYSFVVDWMLFPGARTWDTRLVGGRSMVEIIPYQPRWPEEFEALAARIHEALGSLAVRVDHIGSTSVPGLASKDVIDIQVTLRSADDLPCNGGGSDGRRVRPSPRHVHRPPSPRTRKGPRATGRSATSASGRGTDVTHIHVRVQGRPNQRISAALPRLPSRASSGGRGLRRTQAQAGRACRREPPGLRRYEGPGLRYHHGRGRRLGAADGVEYREPVTCASPFMTSTYLFRPR